MLCNLRTKYVHGKHVESSSVFLGLAYMLLFSLLLHYLNLACTTCVLLDHFSITGSAQEVLVLLICATNPFFSVDLYIYIFEFSPIFISVVKI